MKIFVSHTKQSDYENELYKPLRASELSNKYDFFLPHEGDRNVKTKDEIQASDLLLAEVSYPATGSGIEIGWADAANVPLLFIYKDGAKISGSLKYLTDNFIEYSSSGDLITKLSSYFESKKF
jgi:hypothetical protein